MTDTTQRLDLDSGEQITGIDQHANIHAKNWDVERKHQDIRLAPWQVAFTGVGAGAALFGGAGLFAVLVKMARRMIAH